MYHYLQATGRSGSGKTSGASIDAGRKSGLTHAWDSATARTACGRPKGAGHTFHRSGLQPGDIPDRMLTCPACRQAAGL